MRRVAITNVGAVGPFGASLDEFLDWWKAGRPALARAIESIDEPWLPTELACEVPFWKPRVHLPDRKAIKLMTPRVQFGVTTALQAWGSGVDDTIAMLPSADRRGMFTGAGVPVDEEWTFRDAVETSIVDETFDVVRFAEKGQDLLNPLWLVKSLTNNILAFTAKQLDLQGDNDNFEAGAAGPLLALGSAARSVACDRMEVALAGGADSLVTVEDLLVMDRHGLFAPDAPRTLLPSQGGAFARLEPGSRGQFGVLAFASRMAPLAKDVAPPATHFPPDNVEEALDLATVEVWHQAKMLGIKDSQATQIRGPRLPDGPGDIDLWTTLGDPGAGAGGLLLAAAWALRFTDKDTRPIEIAAAGPSGEVAVALLGTLP
ncbi:MAG: hypothetical protein GY898_05175 [Proteobacteria bacterium]|nr:hypothetical protein [Pseudomonadota bacterium]